LDGAQPVAPRRGRRAGRGAAVARAPVGDSRDHAGRPPRGVGPAAGRLVRAADATTGRRGQRGGRGAAPDLDGPDSPPRTGRGVTAAQSQRSGGDSLGGVDLTTPTTRLFFGIDVTNRPRLPSSGR